MIASNSAPHRQARCMQRWPAVVGQLLNEVAVLVGRPSMPPPKQCFHTRIQILLQVDGFIIFQVQIRKNNFKIRKSKI
jgi:hypothetical protein